MTARTAGIRFALRAVLLAGPAAGCVSPATPRDAGDPVTLEDLAPFPAVVKPENARQVVRQALQRHRRAASDVHRRYAYAFRADGFVQLLHRTAPDRGEKDRLYRLDVDFASIDAVESRVAFDWMTLGDRVEVMLRGRFRGWSALATPYRDPPPAGGEPEARETRDLVLAYPAAEAEAAKRLAEALQLLRTQPSDPTQEAP